MELLNQLRNNKGTVSSELSKRIADEILNGKCGDLEEAVKLTCYLIENKKEKHIRSGAAKIVEIVAMEIPDVVAPYLEQLIPSLKVYEPQTRWMVIRTMGFCAKYNQKAAQEAIQYAKQFIEEKKDGLCMASSVDLFLSDYGELSKENTKQIYPLLIESTRNALENEHDWLLEAFMKVIKYLSDEEKQAVLSFAYDYLSHPRKKTQMRVNEIVRMIME